MPRKRLLTIGSGMFTHSGLLVRRMAGDVSRLSSKSAPRLGVCSCKAELCYDLATHFLKTPRGRQYAIYPHTSGICAVA